MLSVFLSSCIIIQPELDQSVPHPCVALTKQQTHELFSYTVRLQSIQSSSPNRGITGSATVIYEVKTELGWEYGLITAAHVLACADKFDQLTVSMPIRNRNGWVSEVVSKNIFGRCIIVSSMSCDVSIIKFILNEKLPVRVASIANHNNRINITPGDQIFGVGCSFGHHAHIYSGIVTTQILDPTAPIQSWVVASINWDLGSSGGGVYSPSLELIGIISAKQGSGVGFYVPLDTLFKYDNGGQEEPFLKVVEKVLATSAPVQVKAPSLPKVQSLRGLFCRPFGL